MCRCVFMYACVPVYRIRRSTCVGDQVRAQNVLLPVSLWQKYQRGRDHLEGSHGPTQGRHRQWLRLICSVIMSCTLVTPPNVEKTGFFSQLLVGRSSLSICSCVIKSLRDLTAICLRYINYQDEAVQKKKKHFEAPPLFISLTNITANSATSLHFTTACQSLEKMRVNMKRQIKVDCDSPAVTHPNDWLPAAFQSRQQSWSGDTSWCPHCLWGYSLASPL